VAPGLGSDTHVLQRRQVGKDVGDLEGAADTQVRTAGVGKASDVLAFKQDLPGRGLEGAAEQVEQGGLTGPVRPDDGVQGALANLDAHVVHGPQGRKVFAQMARFQDDAAVGHTASHVMRKT